MDDSRPRVNLAAIGGSVAGVGTDGLEYLLRACGKSTSHCGVILSKSHHEPKGSCEMT